VDIAAWLQNLGLARYADTFRDSDIDADVLAELTETDLEKLGISLGHRKKLLKAIAEYEAASRAAAAPPSSTSAVAGAAERRTTAEAERRQLTVLFCDLVGSTELAARLDPEDMGAVMRAYHGACAATVERWGGHVAKYMGDGVLAYFGWPLAHEDEAERAVRAGLEMVAAVQVLDAPGLASGGGREQRRPLAVRVGIATGLVMVGELIGTGAAQEQTVVGETPNLAARLQALAAPGSVVISQATRRLVGGLFELVDLGPRRLKGFAEPLSAWRVEREGRAEGRFEALHGEQLTPLVGREHELGILLERWAWAKDGAGQVVLLAGEPGIGKSRLLRALRQELSGEPHVALSHFCSPYHINSALYPIIAQLERAAGSSPDDAPAAKRAKLAALLGKATEEWDEALPLLAALLGIPASERDPPLNLSPQRQKQRTLEVLIEQLAGLARARPVLELYEDLHWVDPSTLELLDLLVERVRSLPVLAVLTYRPEFSPPWSGQAHVTSLPLNRLGRRQGAAIVERIAGDKPLPAEVVEQIVARTDGVPLFVEELTKTVLESGLLTDAGDRYELSGPLPPLAIPATLHDSLLARLDRLAPVKEVAQTAAVIGREFSQAVLAALSPLSEVELGAALDQLVAAELIFRRGTPPAATYSFKHALVQDAAYQSLLKSKRQQLHARIAHVLEERFAATAATQPELLAYHFAEAGEIDPAIDYWLKAGERAAERSANLEGIRHLTRGLEALGTLPQGTARDRRELAFQIAIGTPLIAVYGYSAPQTGAAYQRARVLCERLGEVESLAATLSGEFVYSFVRGDYPVMRRLVDETRQLVKRLPNPVVRLTSHRLAGITAMHSGAFTQARAEFEAILRLYDTSKHRSQPVHYVHDPKVSALTYLAPGLWILGFPEQACRSSTAAFRCAAELDQANLTAHVHNFAGAGLNELLGDVPAVRFHADAIVELADRHDLGYWRVNGLILRGWAMVHEGAAEPGLALMRQNTADRAALGVAWYQARYLCMLAEVHAQLCQAEPGLRVVAEARELIERNDERMWEGEVDRIEGELLRVQGASVPAVEACFARALAGARQQAAKSLELRAAISLSRLWAEQGERQKAYELLAPVYGWFSEGFDTADLKDAKALLDELA
jgi:class 3 adenylate cyclase/predicted ATPase